MATAPRYGSDLVVDLLRAVGVEHVALNPGATFRGLHDSLVNYGGGRAPELVLTTHEEIAVALAHGYAKAKGAPMAAVVHDIVGLQHASMAIFNAFCDRAPILVLGATGPMDATRRRPWIDWIHTALVQGTQVRDYVKLDDQPASVGALPDAFLRAWRLARTEPQGPVYLCLDAALQEEPLDRPVPLPDVTRFRPAAPPCAEPRAIDEAARRLAEARFPLIVVESLGRCPEATETLCRLAERLTAPLVDLAGESQGRPSVPGGHPLDMSGARHEVVGEADVVLALDVSSFLSALGETDRSTRETRLLKKWLRPGDVFVDAGANLGWFTVLAGRLAGPTGKVFSFEPSPSIFEHLRRNVEINGLANVRLENSALGAAPGQAVLSGIRERNQGTGSIVRGVNASETAGCQVPVTTLDVYCKTQGIERIRMLKIDVEGAEGLVLDGAAQVLGLSEKPQALWIRWPGGKEQRIPIAAGQREVTVSPRP